MMRFERRDDGRRVEFRVSGVDSPLDQALDSIWWDARDGDYWAKTFLDPGEVQAARAFANLRDYLEPTLRQTAGVDRVPWEQALAEVCSRFSSAGVDWWLTGSAALAVRGAPLAPHDLDLIVSDSDAVRAGDVLIDGLIEPVVRGEWDLSEWWGRAFLHARVEWAGGMTEACDDPDVVDFGRTAAAALETIRWREWDIQVPPLRLQREVNVRRGLTRRVAMIDQLTASK